MFEELYSDPARLEQFMGAMAGISAGNFHELAEVFDFSSALEVPVVEDQPHASCSWSGRPTTALPEGGAFIVVENLIDDARRENAFGLLMSLNMLIEFGDAFDYTGADFAGWCTDVGFREVEVIPLAGPAGAAIAFKWEDPLPTIIAHHDVDDTEHCLLRPSAQSSSARSGSRTSARSPTR
jgi:hypothetical protein